MEKNEPLTQKRIDDVVHRINTMALPLGAMPKSKDCSAPVDYAVAINCLRIAQLLEDIGDLIDQYRELANRTPRKPDDCHEAG